MSAPCAACGKTLERRSNERPAKFRLRVYCSPICRATTRVTTHCKNCGGKKTRLRNGRSLCQPCHNARRKRERKLGKRPRKPRVVREPPAEPYFPADDFPALIPAAAPRAHDLDWQT